jgi:hypothetical protein
MVLATARIADFDRFLEVFSTKGAAKRKEHGSRGAQVFRDPEDSSRVWVVFDWDAEGWGRFLEDPDAPAIFEEGGLEGRPVMAQPEGQYDG